MLKIIKVYFQTTHQIKGLGKRIALPCKIRNARGTASNPVYKRNEHHTRLLITKSFTFLFQIRIQMITIFVDSCGLLVCQTYLVVYL